MSWAIRLRQLPLRTKLWITLVGAGVALLGGSTHLSFRYWKSEALAAAEQQALLAAGAARSGVENALRYDRRDQARRTLRQLGESTAVIGARVHAAGGDVVISSNPAEEGRRRPGTWLPSPRELPADGFVRVGADGSTVRAFLPLEIPERALLEVEFSVAPLRAAMDRGARLGLGLMIASVLALAVVLLTMLEREVVVPLERVTELIGGTPATRSEVGQLESSVVELLQQGQEAAARAEEQRQQLAQREGFAQVGELAAEMAHEFKRPLATVRTALGLLEQEYVLDDRGQRVMDAVNQQLELLGETMRDLFTLARPVALDMEVVQLNELLDETLVQLSGHPALAGVTMVRDYGAGDVRIRADRKRLEQALLNLMLNGVEAMPQGGQLVLRTAAVPAGWVDVEVVDSGVGIPAAELERITLPFYSTKPTGTGLGLPLVNRVIAAHGGSLAFDSQPGRGTTVRVRLETLEESDSLMEAATWQTQESSS